MRWALGVKLALGLAGIVTAIMGVSLLLLTMSARHRLLDSYRRFAVHTSDVAEAGLENAMISRNPDEISNVLQAIDHREGFRGVAVLNKRGEIKHSADATEVGRVLSPDDPTCRVCHDRGVTDRPLTVILPSNDKDGGRILRVARPMLNQPRCQGCHQERVLGVMLSDLSLAEPDRQVAVTLEKLLLWALVTMVGVIGAAIGFVHQMITRPLGHFVRVTKAIGAGDLDRRVALTRGDEIGELAASFDQMVQRIAVSETENARLYEEVQAQRARLTQIFDSVNDAIISTDSSRNIIAWNHGAQSIFGYREDEAVGKPLTLLMPERYRAAHQRGLERLRSTGESHVVGKTVELHGLRKNGSEFPLELSVTTWETGRETFHSGVIRDITERKALEQARADFIAMLTHDIRNPLDVIYGYAEILAETAGPRLGEDDKSMLRSIEENAMRILHLAGNFLLASRLEAGPIELHREPLDLSALVSRVADGYRGLASSQNVALEVAATAQPCVVPGDARELERAFGNLLHNAIKYSPTGETVRLGVRAEQRWAVVSVTDRGPGIAPEDQAKLFQRYGQVHGHERGDSTGLGLYIVRTITEAHGGTVEVESAPGRGATFTVHLPRTGTGP